MTATCAVRLAATVAILLLPAAASAQQWQQRQGTGQSQGQGQQQSSRNQGIEQEVRAFLQQTEQRISRAVQQGDEGALRDMTENHVADSANFAVTMQVSGSGRTPKGMRTSVADKQDMLRRQAAMMSLMPDMLNMVQNYDLSIRVLDVEPIGDNAAVVKTRISESATLGSRQVATSTDAPNRQSFNRAGTSSTAQFDQQTAATGAGSGLQSGSQQRDSQTRRQSMSFNAIADCTQLIQRDRTENKLMIGISNCSAELSY